MITNLQEAAFNKHNLTVDQLLAQIRAAEIKYSATYPYRPSDLVSQVQESFMLTRFLPLKQRAQLAAQLDPLLKTLHEGKRFYIPTATTSGYRNWLIAFTAILGTIIALTGILSSFFQLRKARETSISEEVKSKVADIEVEVKSGVDYEQLISDVLLELKIAHERVSERKAIPTDFMIKSNNVEYLIEAKY